MDEITTFRSKLEILANANSFEHVIDSGTGLNIKLFTYPKEKQPSSWLYKMGLIRSLTTVVRNEDGQDIYQHQIGIGPFQFDFDEKFLESLKSSFPRGKVTSEPKF
jgi:hypothetical protein